MKRLLFMALAVGLLASVASGSEFKNGFTVGRGHSGEIVGGWYTPDSTGRYLRFTNEGYLYAYDVNAGQLFYDTKGTGVTSLSLATGVTGRSDVIDLSGYNNAVLYLTWDSADSANVALGLTLYNKQSSAWSVDDTPAYQPYNITATPAAADTTNALLFALGGQLPRPSIYIFRNATAPVGNTYTLTALARTPRVVPNASGIAINLNAFCPSWSYFAFQLTNCNANTVDQIKATLWVSR